MCLCVCVCFWVSVARLNHIVHVTVPRVTDVTTLCEIVYSVCVCVYIRDRLFIFVPALRCEFFFPAVFQLSGGIAVVCS